MRLSFRAKSLLSRAAKQLTPRRRGQPLRPRLFLEPLERRDLITASPYPPIVSPLTAAVLTATPIYAGAAKGFAFTWQVTQAGHLVAIGSGTTLQFVPPNEGAYAVSLIASFKGGAIFTTAESISVQNAAPAGLLLNTGGVR